MSETIAHSIRDFILKRFPGVELEDDVDIFTLGFVNSLFAMELVMFIEQQFDLKVPNEEMRLDNFRTVDGMRQLVDRLRSRAAAGVGEA